MRVGIAVSALWFLPVLWQAPEPVPLATPLIFVPFLAVFSFGQVLRRRWPLLSAPISRASTVVHLALAVATPLLYPRHLGSGDAQVAGSYGTLSASLSGAGLLACAGLLVVMRHWNGEGPRGRTPP